MKYIHTVLTTFLVGSALLLTDSQRQKSVRELVGLLGQGSHARPNTHIVMMPQGAGVRDTFQRGVYVVDSVSRSDVSASFETDSSVVMQGGVRGQGGSHALLAMVLTYGGPTSWWRGQGGTGEEHGAGSGMRDGGDGGREQGDAVEDTPVGRETNQGTDGSSVEYGVENVHLDTYIRIGIDATFTENIPGIKRDVMKQAMHTFLKKFFVYDAKTRTVVFEASKMKYADIEGLYESLQDSKNGLGKVATAKIPLLNIRLHEDPLGDSVDEFLQGLCEPGSSLYTLFVNCTVGVVGHMQQHLTGDLGVDTVAFKVDGGGDIVPTTFVSTLCGLHH